MSRSSDAQASSSSLRARAISVAFTFGLVLIINYFWPGALAEASLRSSLESNDNDDCVLSDDAKTCELPGIFCCKDKPTLTWTETFLGFGVMLVLMTAFHIYQRRTLPIVRGPDGGTAYTQAR